MKIDKRIAKGANIDVRALRKRSGMTQRDFASALGIPTITLGGWERGDRVPAGPSRMLLQLIHQNPEIFDQAREISDSL